MALISSFFGILVSIYRETDAKHKKPHFHAKYNEHHVSIALDGEILAGSLPPKQQRAVLTWLDYHTDEVRAAYDAYVEFGEVIKVRGLQ
jgi:hypothetical protein